MRTTVSIDDDLYAKAIALAPRDMPKTHVRREALQTFIRVQSAQRLAALGGSTPDMPDVPRGRGARLRGPTA